MAAKATPCSSGAAGTYARPHRSRIERSRRLWRYGESCLGGAGETAPTIAAQLLRTAVLARKTSRIGY